MGLVVITYRVYPVDSRTIRIKVSKFAFWKNVSGSDNVLSHKYRVRSVLWEIGNDCLLFHIAGINVTI